MATRSGTLARIRLRAAVRRQSWRKRVGTPAAQFTVPIGCAVEIDADTGTIQMLESAVV